MKKKRKKSKKKFFSLLLLFLFLGNIQKIVKKMLPKYGENIRPLTVLIEGNIGSGKTTFLNHFKKNPEFCLLTEPVEKWRNCGGFNLLVRYNIL